MKRKTAAGQKIRSGRDKSKQQKLTLLEPGALFSRARVGYKAPDEIIVLDQMPTNAVGKVDRVVLRELADEAVNRHLV